MKKFLVLFSCILLTVGANAQYSGAIGARFGKLNNGITYKQFFTTDKDYGFEVQAFYSKIAAQYGATVKGFIYNQVTFRVPVIQLPLDFILGGGIQSGY